MEKRSDSSTQNLQKRSVRFVTITASHAGQRIDNFLMRELKDVPRSYVYRILRKGEVRVDKKRAKPTYKLSEGEMVRIPPVFLPEKQDKPTAPDSVLKALEASILLEDDDLIFINKPSGMAVHGGSGVRYGLIETFRQLRPKMPFVELVHRLDKDTSGIVMLAKNRQTLLELHGMMQAGGISKFYMTLCSGQWQGGTRHIKNHLQKERGRKQKVQVVDEPANQAAGKGGGKGDKAKASESIFTPINKYKSTTLMKVDLLTGRMHQIRTQLADLGHPVLGDTQYGDFAMNRDVKKTYGLKRLFLHAYHLQFTLASCSKRYDLEIPLTDDLASVIKKIEMER